MLAHMKLLPELIHMPAQSMLTTRRLSGFDGAPLQTAFKDYIGALVLHKSSVSGMYLRDDPTILGWELTNSAVCPGDDSGDTVQAGHKLNP